MLGLVGYGSGSDDESDNGVSDNEEVPTPAAPAAEPQISAKPAIFAALPKTKDEKERDKKKEKKKEKKEKKKRKKEKEDRERKEVAKKAKPAMPVFKMRTVNAAPSFESAKEKINKTLTAAAVPAAAPTGVSTSSQPAETTKKPKDNSELATIDPRVRGYRPSGQEIMGSFNLSGSATTGGPAAHIGGYRAPSLQHSLYNNAPSPAAAPAGPSQGAQFPPSYGSGQYQLDSDSEEEPDQKYAALMKKGEAMGQFNFVDVNAADLTVKTDRELREEQFIEANTAPDAKVEAKFYNPKKGTFDTTLGPDKTHKRKHQINQLAHEAAVKELELSRWRAAGTQKRQAARTRYGW